MEFAVSAIFLLILLLPGFILQTAYTKGFWRWNSPTSNRSLTEQVPVGIVFATVLHAAWISLAAVFGFAIDFGAVFMLLTGNYGHDDVHFDRAIAQLTNNPSRIFLYFATLDLVAAAVGYVSHFAVRQLRLDRRTRMLRFNNHWFYLLSGEIAQFQELTNIEEDIDGILLTTVIHHSEADYLYRGLLTDFFFDKEGNLDRVYLTLSERRRLSDDRKDQEVESSAAEERYYDIEGDYLVLKYSEMTTINVDYFFLIPETTSDNASSTDSTENS